MALPKAWNAIPAVVSGGNWEQIQQVIDIDQYIDYQIINRFGGNSDLKVGRQLRAAGGGPFASGRPEQMAPWQLYSLGWRTLPRKPFPQQLSTRPHEQFEASSKRYRNTESDLPTDWKKHFDPGGALTPEATAARWMKFAEDPRPRQSSRVPPLGRSPRHSLHPEIINGLPRKTASSTATFPPK